MFDVFLRHHGIRRMSDTAEMVDAVELYLKGWTPRGRRLVVISNSGATCVMAADAAADAGMPMARLSEETQAGLRAVLPTFAATANPIDTTTTLLTHSRLFSKILPVIARDPAADAFMIVVPVAGAGYDVPVFARDAAHFAAETGKPVTIAAPQASVAGAFAAAGLPVFAYETQVIAALAGFIDHAELVAAAQARTPQLAPGQAAHGGGRLLNEADSLARVRDAGVPVLPHRLCQNEAEAVAALGGPVVVKGCSADVSHKSEFGLVRLNLADPAVVRQGFADCRLGQEAVAWMDGVRPCLPRRAQHRLRAQVGFGGLRRADLDGFVGEPDRQHVGVGLAVDLHAAQAEIADRGTMRTAISPRLATRIFGRVIGPSCLDVGERLASHHGVLVLDVEGGDRAGHLGGYGRERLHHLHEADRVAGCDGLR